MFKPTLRSDCFNGLLEDSTKLDLSYVGPSHTQNPKGTTPW